MTTPPRPCFARVAASLLVIAVFASTAARPTAAGQGPSYVIGLQDVLNISVFGEPSLTGKYSVELDGSISFPLIGHVKAAGLSMRDLEVALSTRLAAGYFRNPQVTVAVEQYRSQRVFVTGEVKNPGAYALTGDMSLIELLAKAGSTTPAAADQATIVRGHGTTASAAPQTSAAENVVRINLKDLQSGSLTRTFDLADGDTIYVPRAEVVYVFGQVKNPGSYSVVSDTTVLQVLSLAGGVLPNGALNRLQVIRVVAGTKKEMKVRLTEGVNPGDTIVVPERFF